MQTTQKYGVIVDGYSSGGEFASAFKERNIECIHVQSNPIIPSIYAKSFRLNDYQIKLIYNNNIIELVNEIKKYRPIFVITGSEPGVELADQLSDYFPVPKNTLALSAARRNKYLMTEQLRLNGLNAITQFKSSRKEEIVRWAQGQRWPLVMKPLKSAGGDCVRVCHNLKEVADAFDQIMNPQRNMLGLKNEEALIQQYVEGKEYVVNLTIFSGTPYLCEIWSYKRIRRGNQNIYDRASLIDYEEQSHKNLVEYAFKVADSLGVQYGPIHAEIMLDEKPILIEAGARVMGGNLPLQLMRQCLNGRSQSSMTVLAYANPEKFQEMARNAYKPVKYVTAFFMISHSSGRLKKINRLDEIRSLPSFHDIKMVLKPGDPIHLTVDYQTSPGMIYLAHEDPGAIEIDCKKIRDFEHSDLYEMDEAFK